tara:strand:+ start:183 stop:929 length:747 start_codon:yes stop_codon:yes gene_type:complete
MIPKIIHQIYWDFSGNNKQMPNEWKEYSKTLKKNNPTWKYKLWNYESCLDLLKNHYPWFLKTYNEYKYPIQRADAIRPFILYHYGGIYFDMDFVCIKNISEYFNKKGVYICESSTTGVTNAFMGSTKNHPFWKNVIEEMMKNNKQKIYQTHHLYIIQSTGPNLITKCYKKYKKNYKNNDIYILPKKLFNACSVCEKKCKTTNKIYCYTVTSMSWNKLDSKIINFIFCNSKIIILILLAIFIFYILNKH